MLRAAAQLAVLVGHIDRAKLFHHSTVRIPVAGPARGDTFVGQLALELVVFALVGLVWKNGVTILISFYFLHIEWLDE